MSYRITVMNRTARIALIREGVAATSKTEQFYEFRHQAKQLPVVRLQTDSLIYRMENFRTFTDQGQYLRLENKPADFFLAGQENESVQQVQHQILASLAWKTTDSVAPVAEVLKREKQREALLVSHSGVMINGNRRLAAMRELYSLNPDANSEFSHVDCMILPEDATPEDIVDIEAALQARPETKLQYDWIGDCKLISRLVGFGRPPEQVARHLRRKPKEIETCLQALSEVDIYLEDWAKAVGDYSRVASGEQFFKDIPALLAGKDPILTEASRIIGWTLFDNRGQLGRRLYSFNSAFGKNAALVLDKLATEMDIDVNPGVAVPTDEIFDIDLGESEDVVCYEPVYEALRDPDQREATVEALIDVCQGVVEGEKSKISGNAALIAVRLANTKLAEVDLSKAFPETFEAIAKQLESIEARARDLMAVVEAHHRASLDI